MYLNTNGSSSADLNFWMHAKLEASDVLTLPLANSIQNDNSMIEATACDISDIHV